MPIPKLFVNRFCQLTLSRDFAEAERVLNQIVEKTSEADWNRGYISALGGVLAAYRTKDDRNVLINSLEFNKENISHLTDTFQMKATSLVSSEFDRGFFAAWVELLRFIGHNKDKFFTKTNDRAEVAENLEEKPGDS